MSDQKPYPFMKISFTSKFKSITSFVWEEIPDFVVITGPNGSGKSQLLELIYNTIINNQHVSGRVQIENCSFKREDVTYLKGEWQINNTGPVDLSIIQNNINGIFNTLRNNSHNIGNNEGQRRLHSLQQRIAENIGKHPTSMTIEEFGKAFPDFFYEQESELSMRIGETFYNYRLAEIELQAKRISEEEIKRQLGQKPWIVLREIIREARLQFEINDPSEHGFRDKFTLTLTSSITGDIINFVDLSSGEKVLMSLVFYLYSSQEKKVFPKLFLLDEPDAHLHPSMSQQFLNVMKNVLVDKYKVKVIMTTHSPSTVVLVPLDSIYEMSKSEPRIRKSPSKNHAVSLLTAGLVYVGDGTRYYLVEDNDDVRFYEYIYGQLVQEGLLDTNIPLVFIPASTKNNSGGKSVVTDWVKKLENSGLQNIIHGLIDADSGNAVSGGVRKLERYSIENYLIDPLFVFAVLIDLEKAPIIETYEFKVGEEYKLKSLNSEILQKIVDYVNDSIGSKISTANFPDWDITENQKIEVELTNGTKLNYPKWLLYRRGKTLSSLYTTTFGSGVNFESLFKAMKKINVFPVDLLDKFKDLISTGV